MVKKSFVPGLSVIKVFKKMLFKLLYSEAYRAPGTQNIDLNFPLAPEYRCLDHHGKWLLRSHINLLKNKPSFEFFPAYKAKI